MMTGGTPISGNPHIWNFRSCTKGATRIWILSHRDLHLDGQEFGVGVSKSVEEKKHKWKKSKDVLCFAQKQNVGSRGPVDMSETLNRPISFHLAVEELRKHKYINIHI